MTWMSFHMTLPYRLPVCRYSHPGRRNTLTLHLSLQRATGRMLVHTFEGGGCETSNTHVRVAVELSAAKVAQPRGAR